MTYFQFHISYSQAGDSYSRIMITDADEETLREILVSVRKDNKLNIGEQEKAIPQILRSRGYSFEEIRQCVLTLENPRR